MRPRSRHDAVVIPHVKLYRDDLQKLLGLMARDGDQLYFRTDDAEYDSTQDFLENVSRDRLFQVEIFQIPSDTIRFRADEMNMYVDGEFRSYEDEQGYLNIVEMMFERQPKMFLRMQWRANMLFATFIVLLGFAVGTRFFTSISHGYHQSSYIQIACSLLGMFYLPSPIPFVKRAQVFPMRNRPSIDYFAVAASGVSASLAAIAAALALHYVFHINGS